MIENTTFFFWELKRTSIHILLEKNVNPLPGEEQVFSVSGISALGTNHIRVVVV